jgi:outer membrane protein
VTYTAFYNEKLSNEAKADGFSNLSLKNSFGLTGQLGMDYALGDSLFLNAAVWRMGMSTTAKMKGDGGGIKVDVDVDPWVYFFGVGFKF